MTFTGFDRAAAVLLDALPPWSPEEFAARRRQLNDGLTGPGRELITELADRLGADLTVEPRRSVSPLHRDLRFAPAGAARYKDHLLLTTWEVTDRSTSPTLWIRVDAHRIGFASGPGFTPALRERWRTAVGGGNGAALAAQLDDLTERHRAEVAGEKIKTVPAPFAADHPRAVLLRLNGFQVRFTDELPETITTPHFASWCANGSRSSSLSTAGCSLT